MLKNIPPILGPELLCHLRAMGHGDELAIVDANFPASSSARRLVRLDAANSTEALEAILHLLPLDTYVECAAHVMEIVGEGGALAPITAEYCAVLRRMAGHTLASLKGLERNAFYERARSAYLIVATGETRLYGNIMLTKGVIDPDSFA